MPVVYFIKFGILRDTDAAGTVTRRRRGRNVVVGRAGRVTIVIIIIAG